MRLDRFTTPDNRNKYALLKLRKGTPVPIGLHKATGFIVDAGMLDMGNKPGTEFFVIRLKDKYAAAALAAYAKAALEDGELEFAKDVQTLADISLAYPDRQKPN